MNKNDLNNLLDSIYELEGLVHLAISRDDNPPALPELITRKGEELASLARTVSRSGMSGQSAEEPIPSEEHVEHVTVENIVTAPSYTPFGTDGENPDFNHNDGLSHNDEKEDTADSDYSHDDDETFASAFIEEEAPVIHIEETVSEAEDAHGINAAHHAPTRLESRGRLVFSINDRYRFKRELFNNSDAEFNNTLALVASMENHDEAEDYFLGELQWDPANQDVTDFLEILKKYFNA